MKTKALETQQWKDMFFRHSFTDRGMYPTNGTQSASPDVMPMGDKPLTDPSQLILDGNWLKDYGATTNASQANYIYLRGQNLGDNERTGRLYLYFSPASLLLWPTDPVDPTKGWAKKPLKTSSGQSYVELKVPGTKRFYTPEPFQWIPQPISKDHYCLVARIETSENPNPIPAPGNLNDFARYISEHPNMAWRNVITINPNDPEFTTQVEYSQGEEGGYVYMNLRCTNCPDGSGIAMNSGTPGPNPPIYYPLTVIKNSPGSDTFTITLYTNIPANWRSNITFTWLQNKTVPTPGMKFVLDPIMPTADDHPLVHLAKPLEQLGCNMDMIPSAGPRRGIVMGSQTAQAPDKPVSDLLGAMSLTRAGAQTGKSSIYFSGISWPERSESVLGSSITERDVSVKRVSVRDVDTEEVAVSSTLVVSTPAADLTMASDFSAGSWSGRTQVALRTSEIPIGSEIWFKNLDGNVPIEVPPTTVTLNPFAVAVIVDLPDPEYSAKMGVYLRLNGQTLPESWRMYFEAIGIQGTEVPAANQPAPVLLVNPGPTPGTLLGRVTIK